MLIYNITFNVEDPVRAQWMDFVRDELIPRMTGTGLLTHPQLMQLMRAEPQGTSFALQFRAEDMRTLRDFLQNHWPAIQDLIRERFGDRAVYFPSTLKILDL